MATYRPYKNKDGSLSYTATVRKKRKGIVVFNESRTFSKKKDAEAWAKSLEVKLSKPGEIERHNNSSGTTLGDLITRYIDEYGSEFGKSKLSHLKLIRRWEIADTQAMQLTPADIVQHIRQRAALGTAPSTCLNDVVWMRSVFKAARSSFNIPLDLQVIEDANDFLHREGLIGKAPSRDRRPTAKELMTLSRYFWKKQKRKQHVYPMFDIMWFAIHSCRREAEITRLRWDHNNAKDLTGLVEDVKHPTQKTGNHRRFKYTRIGWRLANRQPKTSEFIFPYNPKTISAYFANACKLCGIVDLRFHDLRHEACSRLFEAGYDIVQVQMFSLHENWNTLRRYTHLQPGNIVLR